MTTEQMSRPEAIAKSLFRAGGNLDLVAKEIDRLGYQVKRDSLRKWRDEVRK